MGCRLCVSTSRNTRRAGLIHRCGKRRRGLRLRMAIGFDAMGATTVDRAAVGNAAERD